MDDGEATSDLAVSDPGGGFTVTGAVRGLVGFGWGVAKKVAIATVALTTAPVVITPLVILSAVSFPFGALFVGYKCTTGVWRVLVPKRGALGSGRGERWDFGEEKGLEEERENFDEGFEEEKGLELEKEDFGEGFGEEKGLEEEREGFDEGFGEEKGLKGEKEGFDGEEGEDLGEDKLLEGERKDFGEEEGLEEERKDFDGEEEVRVVMEVETQPVEETVGGYPVVSVDAVEREIVMEQRGDGLEGSSGEVGSPALQEGGGFPVVSTTVVEVEREVVVAEGETDVVAETPGGEESVGVSVPVEGPEQESEPAPGVAVGQVEVVDGQAMPSEEEIWEQIDALRKIVGYEAAKALSMMEELKALYLFTGVEPPVSPESLTDLVEVRNKLKFLKSVIGVK